MSGAPWWVVLVAAVIGAAAGVTGTVWAARVRRRAASRAEWFRRLQWAWALTESGDDRHVAVGAIMLDHLAESADRRDVMIIARIAPMARLVGQFTGEFPAQASDVDFYDASGETGTTDGTSMGGTDGEG